jgi:hypothetical protein
MAKIKATFIKSKGTANVNFLCLVELAIILLNNL